MNTPTQADRPIQHPGWAKAKFCRAITRRILKYLAGQVTVIASHPFLQDGKWCILYGDSSRYHISEFPDRGMAIREFQAIENSVLLDFGFPSCDFHILDERDAAKVVDLDSYRLVIEAVAVTPSK